MPDAAKRSSSPFATSDWFFSDSAPGKERRQQRPLELRLRRLLDHERDYTRCAYTATRGVDWHSIRFHGEGIAVPSHWIGREYKDEPRPVLARLLSRKSDLPIRTQLLAWLWREDAWGPGMKSVDWIGMLGPLVEAGDGGTAKRSALRALTAVTCEANDYHSAMAAWSASLTEPPKLAWVTPRRPNHCLIPADFYTSGWHLVLTKNEIGWFLAGLLLHSGNATTRMGNRYLGFSKHATGTEWLSFATVLRAMNDNLHHPAPAWMARTIMQSLGQRARDEWPDVPFASDEVPLLIVRGKTESNKEHVLVGTDRQWLQFRTDAYTGRASLLKQQPQVLPWSGASGGVATAASFNTATKEFSIAATHDAAHPLVTVREVAHTSVWGGKHLYTVEGK